MREFSCAEIAEAGLAGLKATAAATAATAANAAATAAAITTTTAAAAINATVIISSGDEGVLLCRNRRGGLAKRRGKLRRHGCRHSRRHCIRVQLLLALQLLVLEVLLLSC